MPASRTGWLAFLLTIRPDAPFTRTQMQIWFEERDVQTRPVYTGNILRQPAMKSVPSRTAEGGYQVADAVMRGGILLDCHHDLDAAQIDFMHQPYEDVVARMATSRAAAERGKANV